MYERSPKTAVVEVETDYEESDVTPKTQTELGASAVRGAGVGGVLEQLPEPVEIDGVIDTSFEEETGDELILEAARARYDELRQKIIDVRHGALSMSDFLSEVESLRIGLEGHKGELFSTAPQGYNEYGEEIYLDENPWALEDMSPVKADIIRLHKEISHMEELARRGNLTILEHRMPEEGYWQAPTGPESKKVDKAA